MLKSPQELDNIILSFIQKGVDQPLDDDQFNTLALLLFEYQYENNKPYRNICKSQNISPLMINHWKNIPLVPTSLFKETALTCFPPSKAKKIFYTSGTTTQKKGRHYLENLILYEASLLINFKAHFKIKNERWPLLILTPSPQEMPHSSLCHMMEVLRKNIGAEESSYFIENNQFKMDLLFNTLKKMSLSENPVIILGTTFSFVHFLDYAKAKKKKIILSPKSYIMETGGYKEKSREIPKTVLYQLLNETLGVPQNRIINEYGMSEMGSQFYDVIHRDPSVQEIQPYKRIPPWVRTRIVNPAHMTECAPKEVGILQHYDLANRSSVMALLTEDIGIKIKDGFEILGRAPLAEPRGCSIGIETWLNEK